MALTVGNLSSDGSALVGLYGLVADHRDATPANASGVAAATFHGQRTGLAFGSDPFPLAFCTADRRRRGVVIAPHGRRPPQRRVTGIQMALDYYTAH